MRVTLMGFTVEGFNIGALMITYTILAASKNLVYVMGALTPCSPY